MNEPTRCRLVLEGAPPNWNRADLAKLERLLGRQVTDAELERLIVRRIQGAFMAEADLREMYEGSLADAKQEVALSEMRGFVNGYGAAIENRELRQAKRSRR